MKSCELCKSPARIYCESDQASLCWTCDTKVHSANFLVARHSRTLLCRNCQSPTPWSASGQRIGSSAVSVCQKCASDDDDVSESVASDNEDDYDDVTEDDEDEEEEEEEEEDENQVVPWCSTPPPPPASSSGSDDDDDDDGYVKRKRDNVPDLSSEDDETGCSSVRKVRRETTFCDGSTSNSEKISGEKVVVGECKATRGVGLDLNL
ncbi:zinc finger protein CONSTANS-LIKE 1-like protein [Tanacetum coccineum]|uniref:Zinc finger protein CONSTANS-LIKE 1-like protein n=1 Tax=Tanacetum coccineum TaxID=301880 RepID=A0ABQ5GI34_9ASTR